nr:precorrin-3B C(17)-methyltransferase [Desulfuromonas acetoxidans]
MSLVGLGPGSIADRTARATAAICASEVIVGYGPYVDSIADLISDQQVITSGMMKESERCRAALDAARAGKRVALISSGDAGMYGMAGLAMEMAAADGDHIAMEVIPGVTAANSAAALLGAPLMLDSATISLSDLLVPWEMIVTRLKAVAAADLVVSLYNPRSKKRVMQLEEATRIFRAQRPGTTPVGIATAVGSADQQVVLTDLDHLLEQEVGMRSVVIIGNSTTCVMDGRMVTPRGYYEKKDREQE